MAACSFLLAWKIPWTESPVSYSQWGCKRVGATKYTFTHTLNLASPMEGFLSGPLGPPPLLPSMCELPGGSVLGPSAFPPAPLPGRSHFLS